MLPPQIAEIRLIALELATVPEAAKQAESILQLIEDATREEAQTLAIIKNHITRVNRILTGEEKLAADARQV